MSMLRTNLALGLLAMMSTTAMAQATTTEEAPKPFAAGTALGVVNEAGEQTTLSDNVKVFGSFNFAESCTFDPERNLILAMNAGAPQDAVPNDGFVSLINPDGTVHTSKWIGATRDGLTLNQPLGSAIANGTLYAADMNTVRMFDLATGEPGDSVEIPEATVLNGIAVSEDGTVYVTNTSDPQRLYKISPEGESSILVDGEPLARPNGIAFDGDGNVVVVNIGDNAVLTFSPDGELLNTENAVESGNDGIIILEDGTKYVSSVRYGSISRIAEGEDAEIIASGIPSAASICYDPTMNQIIVPMNTNNALGFVSLD